MEGLSNPAGRSAPYWCLPHVVPPVTICLSLNTENALGDGLVALCHFSALDVKIDSKIILSELGEAGAGGRRKVTRPLGRARPRCEERRVGERLRIRLE
eukprot:3499865-Pleurochrysis_carterae.AAC.2